MGVFPKGSGVEVDKVELRGGYGGELIIDLSFFHKVFLGGLSGEKGELVGDDEIIGQYPDIPRILVKFKDIGDFVPRRDHDLIPGTVKTGFVNRMILLFLGDGRERGKAKKARQEDGEDISVHGNRFFISLKSLPEKKRVRREQEVNQFLTALGSVLSSV